MTNYTVSTDHKAKADERQFCVTIEYPSGYQILSHHWTKAEADAAVQRYQAGDKRRKLTESLGDAIDPERRGSR